MRIKNVIANTDIENETMKLNAKNERIKRSYRIFLKEADGKAEGTIEQIMKAIERYEIFSTRADFGTFDQRKAVRFKQHMANETLAIATILTVTTALKRFFGWLSHQPGHKSRISRNDIEYLNLADCDVRAAKAPSERAVPSLEQVCRAFEAMPVQTAIELRDRAVMAILALTGIRDGALITLQIKHFDERGGRILQNPKEVKTKRAKRIDSYLIDLVPGMKDALIDWKRHLVEEQLFAPSDPLFPKTAMGLDANNYFTAVGLCRKPWASAQPVCEIVRKAFDRVHLPYFNPHNFRHMLTSQGYRLCKTPEHMKAWSQNFGHSSILTTLVSYGHVDLERQGAIIQSLASGTEDQDEPLTKGDLVKLRAMLENS